MIFILNFIFSIVVGVFCTSKLWGGQDRMFEFRGGLANYELYYDLSCFRSLLRDNRSTSSGLILKMNMFYKG
jgi:hypothetical protein